MKSLLLFALLAVVLAVSLAHHGKYKRRGCGGYDDDDDMPSCGGRRRSEMDTSHGYGGYGRRGGHGDDDEEEEHVYRFMVGEDFGAYVYLNEEGYLKGFYIDVLMAVCKKAGKKCAYLRDTYDHCWHAEGETEFPGVGMLDEYYEACIGFLPSPDRLNSFNFTSAITPNANGALHWRKDDDSADHKNLTGRSIGFLEGWAFSVRCLKRSYNITGEEPFTPVFYKNHDALVEGLLHKEVDAILSVDVFDSASKGVVPDGPWIQCSSRGLSVMTQYFSDIIPWWNCAFQRLQRSGEFKELCAAGQKAHGDHGKISCA